MSWEVSPILWKWLGRIGVCSLLILDLIKFCFSKCAVGGTCSCPSPSAQVPHLCCSSCKLLELWALKLVERVRSRGSRSRDNSWVLSWESGTSSQRLSYVTLSHRTGLRSLSWRCLWTTCSFWPGLQVCSLGLCLSWPTSRHLSSSWPRAAKRSSRAAATTAASLRCRTKHVVFVLQVFGGTHLGSRLVLGFSLAGAFWLMIFLLVIGVQVFC